MYSNNTLSLSSSNPTELCFTLGISHNDHINQWTLEKETENIDQNAPVTIDGCGSLPLRHLTTV